MIWKKTDNFNCKQELVQVVPIGGISIQWESEEMYLLPDKCIYLPSHQALLIADPHFGKAAHFRKAGIPVPENVHTNDFLKIQRLLGEFPSKAVYFLGDLFHSDWNTSWDDLESFLDFFPETIFHLIKGNHDILPAAIYRSGLWQVHESTLILGELYLSHEPLDQIPDGLLNVCGHIHPGVHLRGKGRQNLTAACFFLRRNQLVMPAFGRFTGLAKMKVQAGDVAYMVAEKKVIAIDFKQ
ncbi:ligase-associated DNA damage response endonuclease PdeM [Mongoliibacter ruber]|uniref:ligase-associated DNA damage response endonuclease PdeM n=1 Tax=Mongoliibacter ruber TaxID=1750599 RepID=UPI001FEA4C37|nr:ligase-associated DNA damage response endonuclease PdeM [Mongoliibacter ruber]